MSRTAKLDELKTKHRERVAKIRAYEDLTPEAKARRIREEQQEYDEARRAEEERVTSRLRDEIEDAYRSAHGPGPTLDAAQELRLARIREEVRDDFEVRNMDALTAYEQALRAGDRERADVIGKMGGRYLEGFRRQRLADLVAENMPEKERRARKRLAELEAEQADLKTGLAMQRIARTGGVA